MNDTELNKTQGVLASGAAWRPHGRCSGQEASVKKYGVAEVDHPGFDASVLTEFRQRLPAQDNPLLMLDRLLARCQELGVLRLHGKPRTDSTHVLAAIRVMNRLELIVETMRAPLKHGPTVTPTGPRTTDFRKVKRPSRPSLIPLARTVMTS